MSDVYQCNLCKPMCLLVANDDELPKVCPFHGSKGDIIAEWRQIQ